MHRVITGVAVACFLATGCASGPVKFDFAKAGVSESKRQLDVEACWNYVLNTPEGRAQVDLLVASRVIGGGVVALAMMGSEQQKPDYNPRNDSTRWPVHNDCMVNKGYAVSFAKPS